MKVYGVDISEETGLTNFELIHYAHVLKIEKFRGVFMRDSLPEKPFDIECAIVNLNTTSEKASHWVCYFKNGTTRIYFDSFGQITPFEIQKYLKTENEFSNDVNVIQRNTDIVQQINTHVCGHLCLLVLTALTNKHLSYQNVLNLLKDGYSQGNW